MINETYNNLRQLIHNNLQVPVYSESTFETQDVTLPCVVFSRDGALGTYTMEGPSVRQETVTFSVKSKTQEQAETMRAFIISILSGGYGSEIQMVLNSEVDEFDVSNQVYSRDISFDVTIDADVEYIQPIIGTGANSQIAIFRDKYIVSGSNAIQVSGSNVTISGSLTVIGDTNIALSSASYAATASYAENASSDWAEITNKPSVVSSSAQVSFNGITDKPTLVSSSAQISYTSITDKPTTIATASYVEQAVSASYSQTAVSASVAVTASYLLGAIESASYAENARTASYAANAISDWAQITNKPTVVSSSAQVSFNGIADKPTLVSASAQIDYNNIQNKPTTIDTASYVAQAVSASYALTASYITGLSPTASYVEFANVANKPTLVSASAQISYSGITDKPTTIATASYVEYANVSNKPSLVSASAQIDYNNIQNKPSTIATASYVAQAVSASFATSVTPQTWDSITSKPTVVSGSAQISFNGITDKPTLISSSAQVSFNSIADKPTLVSASAQISYNDITDKPTTIATASYVAQAVSASHAVTASFASNVVWDNIISTPVGIMSGSEQTVANLVGQNVSLTQLTASIIKVTTLLVETVTSSVVFSTGSNRFGSSDANTQTFTGSVLMRGPLVVGSGVTGSFKGDLDGTSSWANKAVTASFVSSENTMLATLPSFVLSPNLQVMQNFVHSAGWLAGGEVTDSGSFVVRVNSGSGLIRATDDYTAQLLFCGWSGGTLPMVAGNNWIYVTYNGGTPVITTAIAEPTDLNTNITLAFVYRDTNNLHVQNAYRHTIANHASLMMESMQQTMPFAWADGAMVMASTNRTFEIGAGVFWHGLTKINSPAFMSGSSFEYYHRNGVGGWTETTATQINNTQYDDGDGTLGTITNGRYGVHWVFQDVSDGNVAVVYGQGDYALSAAEVATVPTTLPPSIAATSKLMARIIILKSATTLYSVLNYAASHGGGGTVITNVANADFATSASFALSAGSSSFATTASFVTFANVGNKPTLISSSAQVSYTNITDKPTLIASSSWAATASFFVGFIESASYAANANSASYALTASYVAGVSTTTSSYLSGSSAIVVDVKTTTLTASLSNLGVITASLMYAAGTNQFGDSDLDLHRFIGTVHVTGSILVSGSLTGDITASYYAGNVVSSSFANKSILSDTASFVAQAVSSSFASNSNNAVTSSYAVTASYALNGGGGGGIELSDVWVYSGI